MTVIEENFQNFNGFLSLKPGLDLVKALDDAGIEVGAPYEEDGVEVYELVECPSAKSHDGKPRLLKNTASKLVYRCDDCSADESTYGITDFVLHYNVNLCGPEEKKTQEAKPSVDTDGSEILGLAALRDKARAIKRTWIVDHWLQSSHVVLLSGREKRGKSTLVFDLITSVISGQEWLGSIATTQCPVLLLDYENPADYVYENIEDMMNAKNLSIEDYDKYFGIIDPDKIRKVASPFAADYAIKSIRRMEERSGKSPGLLVIDTAAPAFMALFEDSGWTNQNTCVRKAVEISQSVTRETSWCCLIIYHNNKSGTGAAGSYEWTGAPDAFIKFDREEDNPIGKLSFYGRVKNPPAPIKFRKFGPLVRMYGVHETTTEEKTTTIDRLDSFLKLLPKSSDEALSQTAIINNASEHGFARDDVYDLLKKGVEADRLDQRKGARNANLYWIKDQYDA